MKEYEGQVAKGADFGYDKELERILVNHIQEAVSFTVIFLFFFLP